MVMSCEGPACTHEDNQSVLANADISEHTLKKKYSSLAYHLAKEVIAMDNWRTMNIITNDNEEDLITKVLPFG